MAVQDKYKELIDSAKSLGVKNLQVREQNSVLYIDGNAPTGAIKDNLWSIYNKIDPDFKGGDLVLNVNVEAIPDAKAKVVTESSNLNIRMGPGTEQTIVGKAAHNEVVTILNKSNDQWCLIKTDGGIEGYVYTQYLETLA
jgi:uncharacterized protein YgiM (DUF1202 family)